MVPRGSNNTLSHKHTHISKLAHWHCFPGRLNVWRRLAMSWVLRLKCLILMDPNSFFKGMAAFVWWKYHQSELNIDQCWVNEENLVYCRHWLYIRTEYRQLLITYFTTARSWKSGTTDNLIFKIYFTPENKVLDFFLFVVIFMTSF